MPKEKIAFIINPVSGRSLKSTIKEIIRRNIDLTKYVPLFYVTKYPGHANELTYQAANEGCTKVIAVGGDGTVNEIGGVATELKLTLGIIPIGSGNGLARHLGIPLNIKQAIRIINSNNTMHIDAGKINDIWFFCTCGIGFDAKIGRKFSKTKVRGFISYIKTVVREFRRYNSRKYKIYVDNKKIIRRAFLITIANASQYGNNAFIAPQARIDDGFFDVCILKPFPILKVFTLTIMLFRRSLDESNYYEVIRAKQVNFKKPKKKYIFHYDGEPVKFKKEKIDIIIFPKCLEVMVPHSRKKPAS
ncbi:Diacylglycerol kinase [subsurface metagenome]